MRWHRETTQKKQPHAERVEEVISEDRIIAVLPAQQHARADRADAA